MAKTYLFGGSQQVFEPGIYSTVTANATTAALNLNYGNVLVIDTGSAAGWGAAGIGGTIANGANSIFEFTDLRSFREFIRGGEWWQNAEFLFRPNGPSSPGISKLYWVSARTATASTITLTLAAGNVIFNTIEGVGSVGVTTTTGDKLLKGFSLTLSSGVFDTTAFIVKFWRGDSKGVDSLNRPWDGISDTDSTPVLIAQSPEIKTIAELQAFCQSSSDFQKWFTVGSSSATTGNIVSGDLATNVGNIKAVGGTESYVSLQTRIDEILLELPNIDFNLVISDKSGANAASSTNVSIATNLATEHRDMKFLIVGGGSVKSELTSQSVSATTTFNSSKVVTVHGGFSKSAQGTQGTISRTYGSLAMACIVAGRISGLTPQTPITFKAIDILGLTHVMNTNERKLAISKGVLHVRHDSDLGSFVINWGLTTIQDNNNIITNSGQSRELSIMRIIAQLNREVIVNGKIDLFGNQESGPNRSTLTSYDVIEWVKGFLQRKKVDGLIIRYENVTASVTGDVISVNYSVVPNWPINFLFVTGTVIDK